MCECKCKSKDFKSRKEGKDPESIQLGTIPDLVHQLEKWRKHKKHNTQESQEASPFPASDHKAARNRQNRIPKPKKWYINNKTDPQKKLRLWNSQQNKNLK